jgi:hypothetical protein
VGKLGIRIPLCRCYAELEGGTVIMIPDYGGCSEMKAKMENAKSSTPQIKRVWCEEDWVEW